MLNDLRYALRTLSRARGFAIVAIAAIAIGIGANTAIFSVVNAVLLTPLPYRDSQSLVLVQERIPKISPAYFAVSAPDVLDLARWTQTLDSVSAFEQRRMNLASGSLPKRVTGARVSANLFPTLGIAPQLGRFFTKEEDAPGQLVTILSYGLWADRFGADPNVIGSKVLLDGESYVVTGVMPREFSFPPPGAPGRGSDPIEFWIPMAFNQRELEAVVDNFDIGVVGHLKPGATIQQARSDIARVGQQIQAKYSFAYKDGLTLDMAATPLNDIVAGPARPLLLPLLGAVGFVLLIACANVANLLLSRAAGRQHEIAIRTALGASRARVVRQVLTESLVLSVLGGALGVSLAWLGLSAFVAVLPASIPHSSDITLDPRVLAFAAGLSLLTGIVFGSVPALGMGRGDTAQTLNEVGRGTTAGAKRKRLKAILVVCDIALSVVLLMGAGLLIRSYINAVRTDPGFRPERVLSFSVALPENQYASRDQVLSFYRAMNEKLDAIPGVRVTGNANFLPLMGSTWNRTFVPEGFHATDGKIPLNDFTPAYGAYLQALGVPLIRGRYFTDSDRKGTAPVVIVSENLARQYWPGQDPIGKRLKYGGPDSDRPWATVVGVVANVKASKMEGDPLPHSYQPIEQAEEFAARSAQFFVVRSDQDPVAIFSSVRGAVASLDKELPIARMRVMREMVDESLKPRQFSTWLVGIFAAVALFLSILGIYGVIAFSVTQRTQEIGIRMALGAYKSSVLMLFLREGLLLALTGVVAGAAASFALTRYLSSQLYGVEATDALTLTLVAVVLTATSLLATYLPARRAMRLDPMLALRHQ